MRENRQRSGALYDTGGNVVTYKDGSTRMVDPAVAKLKAARKAAEEAKQNLLKEIRKSKLDSKPRLAPAKKAPVSKTRDTSSQARRAKLVPLPMAKPKVPEKKLNFAELMKQAKKIDGTKLAFSPVIKPKTLTPPPARRVTSRTNGRTNIRASETALRYRQNSRSQTLVPRLQKPVQRPMAPPQPLLPAYAGVNSIRKPTPKESRREESDEYDSEDDFIVLDEDEGYAHLRDTGYDRDEIWQIFNKGKKREYYDDDSGDDMEATGAEVLMEESRSTRQAQEEDRREQDRERRLQDEKARRKRMAK
ncbi:hypothetical protein BABINDRAFT_158910 [Babjeviella inositovora NRRL Y-12698]|uniref:SPT2 chromatin protein n=1 Tax=Babjeviella inositovora NRRL Y-12698 TaxID=984486 RepID=A0A1E3QX71_9ASCO|nr:uncharacterized protein BABINDRAFT_158910 [Babjeviella inositovora NRRL Y-12698]ODQ82285.1 hypothetical protein BABINDRAFT_158910 [Babjeviella inositovora NRRL Y-12698]